jgi:hypothetical protein
MYKINQPIYSTIDRFMNNFYIVIKCWPLKHGRHGMVLRKMESNKTVLFTRCNMDEMKMREKKLS